MPHPSHRRVGDEQTTGMAHSPARAGPWVWVILVHHGLASPDRVTRPVGAKSCHLSTRISERRFAVRVPLIVLALIVILLCVVWVLGSCLHDG